MEAINSLGYQVHFDEGLQALKRFLDERHYSKILVLVDRNTAEACLPFFQHALPELSDFDIIEVDPGEENKNIDFCIGVWKTMLDFGADRKSLMINLGGGVVTDMGGFAASTYMRGIDFVQVPTTLLAQVDASVGGKTGIDLDGVKNMVGTFTQPQAVFISTRFLESLDARQLISGFAEMLKHGLIQDADFFEQMCHHAKSEQFPQMRAEHIRDSVAIKNKVILEDPLESGLRKILNFGHTIGHAVETWILNQVNGDLLHGEAVALGMICEAYLSHKCLGLPEESLQRVVSLLLAIFPKVELQAEAFPEILAYMQKDKKNEQDRIGFALLREIGHAEFNVFVKPELILESLVYYQQLASLVKSDDVSFSFRQKSFRQNG